MSKVCNNLNDRNLKDLALQMVKEIVNDCSSGKVTVNQLRMAIGVQLKLWVKNNQLSHEKAKIVVGYTNGIIDNITS